ncbi:MAG: Hpt domain-containing protein [Bacilli bacterium]|nr:Hpt domain-containing protein [Bacilli bacterium]
MDTKILTDNKIDVNHGLELLGDIDFYNETLGTFYDNIEKNLKDLKNFKDNKDFENYGILSHSIKSDSKYLGFMDLAEIALSHEMAGKSSDEKFIEENYDSFVLEINRIVSVVKEYLGR